jgi:TetR/AcrR family transcriptional regulator
MLKRKGSASGADTYVRPAVQLAAKSGGRARRPTEGSLKTREMIMEAATEEFGSKGFDGARVDVIAMRAGVQKNLIYHHFGQKDQLFTTVLERMYEVIRARQQDLRIRNLDPVEGMRRLVVFTGKIWIQYPHFQRLIYSANLHGGRHVRASDYITNVYHPLVETISDLLKRGREAGLFREEIDPIDLYVSISALTAHYFSKYHSLEAIFQERMMTPQRLQQRLKHASEVILRFVMVDPRQLPKG